MDFLEELPPECPPAEAADSAYPEIWRVVRNQTPDVDDFLSLAALGAPPRKGITACRLASCSLFTSRAKIAGLAPKLPKTRFPEPYIATLKIDAGSGRSIHNAKTRHVDFWMFKDFDPVSAIQAVEKCE